MFSFLYCLHLAFLHSSASSQSLQSPPQTPASPPCLLQQSLSCDKDGTCSWSSSCYASRSAAPIFWHWSPSNCQQQTGTEGWGWGWRCRGGASVFLLINNFSQQKRWAEAGFTINFCLFFSERGNWDGWCRVFAEACQREGGRGRPIAVQGSQLSHSPVRRD